MIAGEVWYRKSDNTPVTILASIDLIVFIKYRRGVVDEIELSEFEKEFKPSIGCARLVIEKEVKAILKDFEKNLFSNDNDVDVDGFVNKILEIPHWEKLKE